MSADKFSFSQGSFPAIDWDSITPDDDNDLSRTPRSLYIGNGGNIKVTSENGKTVTFNNVVGGTVIPIQPARIHATGTTATDIIALI